MEKTVYKLFRVLKSGEITSLFINKTRRLPIGKWLKAEPHPTKGFKFRPQWHCTEKPNAPHLSNKNRVWKRVLIRNFKEFKRPASQGGTWILSEEIKILE